MNTRQRILECLHNWRATRGGAPTVAEIAAAVGLRSHGVVHRHLKALEAAGLIAMPPRQRRSVRLLGAAATGTELPLLGCIAAGRPIEAITDAHGFDLRALLGVGRYALRVQGDSMIEAGILDGDAVAIEACEQARNGAIVVALLDDGSVTLKYYHPRPDGSVVLAPANAALELLRYPAERVRIPEAAGGRGAPLRGAP
ncbi:repressor LexA [Plasticicumulans lactativorans]|uniref:Repressor LexA n=1 Tax=Plasticicumulans lactativorans TaxID=1133106 RepID=A0A4R2L6F1_9GAMM|nr:transcriptional repressor LexA [Plasticicumulans lactativorans]TCO82978.1 repressor LexA [Plasticicumulans lactativorans]